MSLGSRMSKAREPEAKEADPRIKPEKAGKSGWQKTAAVAGPAIGFGLLAGTVVYSMHKFMQPLPAKDWNHARDMLANFGLVADNLEEDCLLYVLYNDVLSSCDVMDQASINMCGRSMEYTDSLLKLEFTLQHDARVSPQASDIDRAKMLAVNALACLNDVESLASSKHYIQLVRSRKRLSEAILRHMRVVVAKVARDS